MNLERMCHAERKLKLALGLLCCIAGLVLLPARLSAQINGGVDGGANVNCASPNPNPNPNPTSFAAVGDFNGDCKSDLLWRDSTTGQVYVWSMNGATIVNQATPGTVSTAWTIVGVGDFDGDGKSDVLWRNSSTGQLYIWFMNGATITSQVSPGTVDPTWSIQGVADFDGDGKSDLVWRNMNTGQVYIWFMNGATIGTQATPATIDPAWSIEGVGDFNGDGKADLLWQNGGTGQVYIWLMNGATITSQTAVGTVTSDWSVQSVTDFNGDGKSDLLWRSSNTGQLYIWLMNGAAVGSQASPGTIAAESSTQCCSGVGNGWTILGTGDLDGDGKGDIVWRQLTTGQIYVWLMNGTSITSQLNVATIAPKWEIATLAPYGCSNEVLCNILSATNDTRANGPFGPGNPAPSSTAGGPLVSVIWDPGAERVAKGWAAQCNFAHNMNNNPYGENIYAAGGQTTPVAVTGTDAVTDWSAESANYTYSGNTCSGTCGHYTQLVWRSTTAVGCAVQQCTTNSPFGGSFPDWVFVVCDYSPPGNWTGVSPY